MFGQDDMLEEFTYCRYCLAMYRQTGSNCYLDEVVKMRFKSQSPKCKPTAESAVARDESSHPARCEESRNGTVGDGLGLPGFVNGKVAYELTLTTPEDDPYYLRTALSKIVSSNMFDVTYYKASMELTKDGKPHIHAILFTKRKYLDSSKVKKLFKYRYELKRVRDLPAYLNYIKKEFSNVSIIDYCAVKGIEQFWDGENV